MSEPSNLRLLVDGMGYAKGEVVPPSYFDEKSLNWHLNTKHVEWCHDPATVSIVAAADVSQMDDDELAAENAKLKAALADLPQKIHQAESRVKELEAENASLKSANETGAKELSAAVAMIEELTKQITTDKNAKK